MVPWMSRSCYHRAIFNGYADYLSILTIFVSFGLISGSHHVRLMAIRCLAQIFTDLLWKRRPPWKPPWNQFIRTLPFVLSTTVEKDMEIMNLLWVICNSITTNTMPSLGVGVGDVCLFCYVTGDDGMTTRVYPVRISKRTVCRLTQEEAVANSAIDDLFFSAWLLTDEAIRRRIKRPNHQHDGVRRRHNTLSRSSFLFQREADVITMTSKSRQLKVMLKAFWSLSYMLLAINIKYMKGGSISHSLIACKAYVQQAGLTAKKRLYPSSLSLLYEGFCVSKLVYPNDVLFCY